MGENDSVSANSEIILNIKSQMQQMNPAQTRIARYILENPEKVEGLSIGNFAKESKVSEATISRFVKFLGCANYREFQAEMVKSNILNHQNIRGYAGVDEMSVSTRSARRFLIQISSVLRIRYQFLTVMRLRDLQI